MPERALRALPDQHRRAEVDAAYERTWREHPLDEADEWADLASFGEAVSR